MEGQIVLVTGASGFIGTNLTRRLLQEGCKVIALDREKSRCRYFEYRCMSDLGTDIKAFDLLTVTGDIRNEQLLREIFQYEIRYVVHLAALSTIQMGEIDCRETMSVNVDGTEALLKAAHGSGKVRGFLYASTDKVYGKLHGKSYSEEDEVAPLKSTYDCSKAAADKMVRDWSKEYGFHGIVLRFCNIYGKYDLHSTRIVPATIQAVLEERDCVLKVYRDGDGHIQNFRRDFLYVEDLCGAIWEIITKLDCGYGNKDTGKPVWGEAFNLGAGCDYPMDEIIWEIQKIVGKGYGLHIEIADTEAEVMRQCMDSSKAQSVFGFDPKTTLQEGLRETVAWWIQTYGSGEGIYAYDK